MQFTQNSSNILWVYTTFTRKLSITGPLSSLPGPPCFLNVLLGKSLSLKGDGADSQTKNLGDNFLHWLFVV